MNLKLQLSFLLLSLLVNSSLNAEDGSGLKISAAVDMTAKISNQPKDASSSSRDALDVREAEILLTSPIDHIFDGWLSFAAHREDGVALAEIHEAYISTSKLIPRSRIRVGQYFLGVGRLNRFHRHEWPMISAPQSQLHFFGEEGAIDTGIEYSYLFPTDFYLDLTAGTSNGYTYGHSHNEGQKPKVATHYFRSSTYQSLFLSGGVQTGLNYLSRTSQDATRMTLTGIDLTAKWKKFSSYDVLLQSEVWLRETKPLRSDKEKALGAYAFVQTALSPEIYCGVLFDYYELLDLKDLLGRDLENNTMRYVPTLTYKPSEFSTFRMAYNWGIKQENDQKAIDSSIQLQASFILGAHPAHEF